jgi:uncharacterized small protein (DUF1192 family)
LKIAVVNPFRADSVAAAVACALALGFVSPGAAAFGFGEPIVSSALGQPLRMRIPVRVDPEIELTSQCVRLLANPGSDGIPTMTMAMARITIERKGEERILRIDSLYPVNEPVMRVSVEAGCAQHARREFMLLLDPPDTLPQMAMASPIAEAPSAGVPPATTPQPADTPAAANPALTAPAAATDAPGTVGMAASGTPGSESGNDSVPAVTAADAAPNLVLGGATIMGRVGEPLSMEIPVTGAGAAALEANCVRLAGAWNGEGAPVLSQARLNLVKNGTDTQIDLHTQNPVTEPAMRVILEVGCGTAVRREYAVLLDKPLAAPEPAPAPASAPAVTANALPPVIAGTSATAAAAAGGADAPPRRAKPRPPRKIIHAPLPPAAVAVAPAQSPAPKPATPPAPVAPEAVAKPKPAPAADHLVLSAPTDQPDPAVQRLAEMDKRIADLTKEVTELRTQLVAERQKAAEAAQAAEAQQQRLGAGWIVAILALLGLGVAGLLTWQRKRNALPWEKTSWEPANTVAAAPDAGRPSAPVGAGARAAAPAASAPREIPRAPQRAPDAPIPFSPVAPAPVAPPAPAGIRSLSSFQELTGTNSTITPGANGLNSRIEVTELHADDPELEKMHTVFLEPGNLDAPPPPPAGAMHTRVPGQPSPITELPPITQMPPMPSPTIVAPEQRHGAFTFDEGPYTQTPTMLVLDLDLTTRALPVEEAEAAKFAEKPKDSRDAKDGKSAGGGSKTKG